jgi:hypothetical protein
LRERVYTQENAANKSNASNCFHDGLILFFKRQTPRSIHS